MKMARILCGVLILLPVVVGVQKDHTDSLFTDLTFGGGAGSYAGRYYTRHYSPGSGCDGGSGAWQYIEHRKKISFKDAGFGIDHQVSKDFRLGLRTGYVKDKRVKYTGDDYSKFKLESNTSWIFNPYMSVEGKSMGFGLGPVISTKGIYYPSSKGKDYAKDKFIKKTLVSYHLRFGSPKSIYASLSRLENIPLMSGGGYLNYGLGTEGIPRVSLWVGGSGNKPFDSMALLVKVGAKLSPHWTVYSTYRSGETEGDPYDGGKKRIDEKAFSVKLNYRFFRK
jgi:hypothetical protein